MIGYHALLHYYYYYYYYYYTSHASAMLCDAESLTALSTYLSFYLSIYLSTYQSIYEATSAETNPHPHPHPSPSPGPNPSPSPHSSPSPSPNQATSAEKVVQLLSPEAVALSGSPEVGSLVITPVVARGRGQQPRARAVVSPAALAP